MDKFSRKDTRLDDFWISLLSEKENDELKTVLQLVLILSHGNAEVERGYSVNEECLQDNMAEPTLIAYRTVYDTVLKIGGVHKVDITKFLLHSAKTAHALYKEFNLQKPKAETEKNEEKMKLNREKKMIMELEEKTKKVMEKAKNEVILLQKQILELERK